MTQSFYESPQDIKQKKENNAIFMSVGKQDMVCLIYNTLR